jgi:hypothetical protein
VALLFLQIRDTGHAGLTVLNDLGEEEGEGAQGHLSNDPIQRQFMKRII